MAIKIDGIMAIIVEAITVSWKVSKISLISLGKLRLRVSSLMDEFIELVAETAEIKLNSKLAEKAIIAIKNIGDDAIVLTALITGLPNIGAAYG